MSLNDNFVRYEQLLSLIIGVATPFAETYDLLTIFCTLHYRSAMAEETKFNKQLLTALDTATVGGKLAALIKDCVTEALAEQNRKIADLTGTINMLRDDLKSRDKIINDLVGRNNCLAHDNEKLTAKIMELENYQRRDNLVFSGLDVNFANVASSDDESATNIVNQIVSFCNAHLSVPVQPADISVAHLLPARRNVDSAPRQVIVRFTRRCMRDLVYRARMKLKEFNRSHGKKIYVNEDMSPASRLIFKEARQLFKNKLIKGCWTRTGKVMLKTLQDTEVEIKKREDLEPFARQ